MTLLSEQSVTSDKDYLKIQSDGQILINCNGTPDADSTFPQEAFAATYASSQAIVHGLGTIPLVRGFWDPGKNGRWWASHAFPDSGLGLFPFQEVDPFLLMISDISTVKFIMGTNNTPQTNIPVFYRIYDLGNAAVTSDSRIDKIFFKQPGTSAVAAAALDSFTPTFSTYAFPHGQTEAPIWTLQFSEDNSNWYNENGKIVGPPDTGSGPPGGPYSIYYYTRVFCYADASNFYVVLESNYTSSKTIYFRYSLDYRA
jgi:hypothetical protein